MNTSTLKYSPLRGAYVDSRGRIATEKKAVKMPTLKMLDMISAVILVIVGCFAVYFLLNHSIHMNTKDGVTLIAVTPKDGVKYVFETEPKNAQTNTQNVHVVNPQVINIRK